MAGTYCSDILACTSDKIIYCSYQGKHTAALTNSHHEYTHKKIMGISMHICCKDNSFCRDVMPSHTNSTLFCYWHFYVPMGISLHMLWRQFIMMGFIVISYKQYTILSLPNVSPIWPLGALTLLIKFPFYYLGGIKANRTFQKNVRKWSRKSIVLSGSTFPWSSSSPCITIALM